MNEAREALDQQRSKMYAELDTAAEEYAELPNVLEYAARWGIALRAVLDLIDGCETAVEVSEGTILGVAVKIRMGAYENVRKAITDALGGSSEG